MYTTIDYIEFAIDDLNRTTPTEEFETYMENALISMRRKDLVDNTELTGWLDVVEMLTETEHDTLLKKLHNILDTLEGL